MSADQLESVLSLCLFTAQKEAETRSKDGQTKFNLYDANDDWLRQETMDSGPGIRLIGSKDAEMTNQLIQQLRWWAPETFDILAEVTEFPDENNAAAPVEDGRNQVELSDLEEELSGLEKETRQELDVILKSDPKWDDIHFDNNRVVGLGPPRLQAQGSRTRQRRFRNLSTVDGAERRKRRRGTLAIESNGSLEKLFSKDLLFSFLISVAKTLTSALQGVVITRETTAKTSVNNTSKALVTSEITSLAAEFGRLGYGAEQEVWLSIIAPLSMTGKLPFPQPLLDLARERAERMRVYIDLTDTTDVYLDLWKQTQRLSLGAEKIHGWGTSCAQPMTSIIRASGSLLTPITKLDTIPVALTRPCRLKLLTPYSSRESQICCWNESVKWTSQMLHQY